MQAKPFCKVRDVDVDIERMCRKTEGTKYRSRQELLDDLASVCHQVIRKYQGTNHEVTMIEYARKLKAMAEEVMGTEFADKPADEWEETLRNEKASKGGKGKGRAKTPPASAYEGGAAGKPHTHLSMYMQRERSSPSHLATH